MAIVFFDLETSGLDSKVHDIIQFAAVVMSDDLETELNSLNVKIEFDRTAADPAALAINSFDAATWGNEAIEPLDAIELIGRFFRQYSTWPMISKRNGRTYHVARVAAHNAAFDAPFLESWWRRYDGGFLPAATFEALCTLQLSRWVSLLCAPAPYAANHKLGTLCAYFGVPLDDAHDALADARAAAAVCRKLQAACRELAGKAAA